MISGGGSAQVDAPGAGPAPPKTPVWFPTSPLDALEAKAPNVKFTFASGENIAETLAHAKRADVAIVFAWQWEHEEADVPNLSLPQDQDKLIAAVAAANPHTIVVLETGTAVKMPWLAKAPAVLEAWYGGASGADAVANLLFGDVNPSGKLPMTFPMSEDELPRPVLPQPKSAVVNGKLNLTVDYNVEGAAVGYKWYQWRSKNVLFPFGFGLSYTQFRYSDLRVSPDGTRATLTLTNIGDRKGADIAEVYVTLPASAGEPWKRLAGWQKAELESGEKRTLRIDLEPLVMRVWNEAEKRWERPQGTYSVEAGSSSADLPLEARFTLK
jgi:beta-glucosidase